MTAWRRIISENVATNGETFGIATAERQVRITLYWRHVCQLSRIVRPTARVTFVDGPDADDSGARSSYAPVEVHTPRRPNRQTAGWSASQSPASRSNQAIGPADA